MSSDRPTRDPMWRRYLRFWRADVAADVDEEIAFHLAEREADLVAGGMRPGDARAQAEAEFGDVGTVRARLRAMGEARERRRGRAEQLEVVAQDVRYAARSLARAPALVATVVATLALGLGANGAVFALVDRLFLRPPPGVAAPEEVHRLYVTQPQRSGGTVTRAPLNYLEVSAVAAALEGTARVAGYRQDERQLGRGPGAEPVSVVYAGAGYFATLGVRPAMGRTFLSDEERIDAAAPVAVLSEALWRRAFGADPAVVGRTFDLGRERLTVVGVAPRGFRGVDVEAADLWLPLGRLPLSPNGRKAWYETPYYYGLRMLLRPAARADVAQVAARATTAVRRAATREQPRMAQAVATVGPLTTARGPQALQPEASIAIRLAAVSLAVLLVACANVANLLLARGLQRRRELAVRLALGVRAGRLRALLATEAVLLALVGGAVALAVAAWGGAALRAWLMPEVRWDGPALDGRVATFLAVAALLTGGLAGLAPAVRAGRGDLTRALKAGLREGTAPRSRLRTLLVAAQAALSVVLVAGAGLCLRSYANVRAVDIGFDAERLVFAGVSLDEEPAGPVRVPTAAADARAAAEARRRQWDREARGLADVAALAARPGALPGVEHAALATMEPLRGFTVIDLFVDGLDSLPVTPSGFPAFTGVSPTYFATAGLRIVRGRGFTDADAPGTPRVLVVNETMARTLWPGADPIGRCVRVTERTAPCVTVVGVVEDARRGEILEPPALLHYAPLAQPPADGLGLVTSALVLRAASADDVGDVVAATRRALAAEFPGGVPRVTAMADVLAPQLRPWRLAAILFSLLGGLALAVATVGVYGAVTYATAQRRHEFGVRLALGAGAGDLTRAVLHDGVRTVAAGVALGVALALAAGRFIASLVYGVSTRDPVVLVAAAVVLLGATLVASLRPARRAARTDPVEVLRAD